MSGLKYYQIHNQLVNVHKTRKFFFTFYVIWVAARARKFLGLQMEGELRGEEGQKKLWEYYTQIPLNKAKALLSFYDTLGPSARTDQRYVPRTSAAQVDQGEKNDEV